MIRKINTDLRTFVLPVHVDPRPGDIRHSFADISAAEAVLRFSPLIRFDEGLKKTISWYQDMKGTP
jgi:UDP-glucose 4-epimerase